MAAWVVLLAAAVVALAVAALAVVVARAADARRARPRLVVNVEPNQWCLRFADLVLANYGDAPAFDVRLATTPPIVAAQGLDSQPFRALSVVRPGQTLVSAFEQPKDPATSYAIDLSWAEVPGGPRAAIAYRIDVGSYEAFAQLGTATPLVQIAHDLKKLGDHLRHIPFRNNRLQVDAFGAREREEEEREFEARMEAWQRAQEPEPAPTDTGSGDSAFSKSGSGFAPGTRADEGS